MLTRLLICLIAFYQRWFSPLTGDCCRFEPSCSQYSSLCLKYHGAVRGGWMSLTRLLRCNPLFSGGVELPPMPSEAPDEDRQIDWERLNRRLEARAGLVPVSRSLAPQRGFERDVTAPMRNGVHRP